MKMVIDKIKEIRKKELSEKQEIQKLVNSVKKEYGMDIKVRITDGGELKMTLIEDGLSKELIKSWKEEFND